MANQKPISKLHTFSFRANKEQFELINKIVEDLGLDTKTEAFGHLCEIYKHALKIIRDSK